MLQPNDGLLQSQRRAIQNASARAGSQQKGHPTGNLLPYYERLFSTLGPQGWWPAQTRLEVILGAILTQNTTWSNAARAIAQLRQQNLLSLERLRALSDAVLQKIIRPAGFFNQKSRAIRGFINWLDSVHGGSLDRMLGVPTGELRADLLALSGIGPETADAILLYAAGKPFFVADAYTRRILARHGFLSEDCSYQEAQSFIHGDLEPNAVTYNEYHALLVEVGKRWCKRSTMECSLCPLQPFLPAAKHRETGERHGMAAQK